MNRPNDISDRFVRTMQLRTLRGFCNKLVERSGVDPKVVEGLRKVVELHGIESVEYDDYLRSMGEFDKGADNGQAS